MVGHHTSKFYHIFTLGWGHCTKYLFKNIHMVGDWVGGWVAGSFGIYYHLVAPSCKLELARFSAPQDVSDGHH